MNKDKLAEYIIDRILKGDVFFLGNDDIVKIQEKESDIKFERTDIRLKKIIKKVDYISSEKMTN